MTALKITRILDLHGIPHYEQAGRILADSMIGGTALFEQVEDVTDWSFRRLLNWLGY